MSSMIYRLSLYLSLMHISTGFADQFDKYSYKTIDMNVGKNYDFLSIMHYDRRAFTKNGKETIVRIDNQAQEFGMPDLKSLSPMDILELNALYDCKSMSLLFLPIFGDCNSVKRACVTGGIIFCACGSGVLAGKPLPLSRLCSEKRTPFRVSPQFRHRFAAPLPRLCFR